MQFSQILSLLMSRTVRGSLSFSPRVSKRNFKEERDEKWWLKKVRGEINAAAPMLSRATPTLSIATSF